MLTLFLYLSDVEEGGMTDFPVLNHSVAARAGRAVLWPSVRAHDFNVSDQRTTHEALPVTRGVKYAANAWLHLYDFRTPHGQGCAP
jgi:prolyl 4-hydroxylase